MPATTHHTMTLRDDPWRCPACGGLGSWCEDREPYGEGYVLRTPAGRCECCCGAGKVRLSEILSAWVTGTYSGYDVDPAQILTMLSEAVLGLDGPQLPPAASPVPVVGAGGGSPFPAAGAPAAEIGGAA